MPRDGALPDRPGRLPELFSGDSGAIRYTPILAYKEAPPSQDYYGKITTAYLSYSRQIFQKRLVLSPITFVWSRLYTEVFR